MAMTGGVYVLILYLPIWFQDIRGSSPLSSGVLLMPTIAGYVVSSIIAGGVTSGTGYYNPAIILGTALTVARSALITTINIQTSTARIVGYQLLYGFGVGTGFGQPSYVVQMLLPTADIPVGLGVRWVSMKRGNPEAMDDTGAADSDQVEETQHRTAKGRERGGAVGNDEVIKKE
ncbi:hypothetical protein GGR52DRAFT_460946 [Hypoxylon sp. FL1284]|nr:hypothetical protein GGR52DRAFT_460946 [Hypoxylon sp. FL1284]